MRESLSIRFLISLRADCRSIDWRKNERFCLQAESYFNYYGPITRGAQGSCFWLSVTNRYAVMILVKEIHAKSIISKSNLPGADYVINPYTGCGHGCAYCYARFMKRFSGHDEPWGTFVDIKRNGPELTAAKPEKYKGKSILISSVTDPYQFFIRNCSGTDRNI